MTLLKPLSELLTMVGTAARLGSHGIQQVRAVAQSLVGRLDTFEQAPPQAVKVVKEGLIVVDERLQIVVRRLEDFTRWVEEPYAWFIGAVDEQAKLGQTANQTGPQNASPRVAQLEAFVRLQNERCEGVIRSYPERASFAAALAEKASHTEHGVPIRTKAGIFYSRRDPGQAQPIWYYRGETGREQELLNPTRVSEELGRPITIAEVRPSPSGCYVSYLVRESTSDVSHLYIRDVSTGKDLYIEGIAGTMAADVQWRSDEMGFYYMGQPKGPYRHPKTAIRYHKIGTGVESDAVIYEARNPVNWVSPKLSPDGKILLIGDYKSRDQIDYVAVDTTDPSHPVRDLLRDSAHRVHIIPGDDRFFLLTNEGAPNFRVQILDFGTDFSARRDFIAEAQPIIGEYNILGGEGAVTVTQNCLLIHAIVEGGSALQVYNLDGSYRLSLALPGAGQVSHLVVDRATETVSFHFESPLHAIQAMQGDLVTGKVASIHDVDPLIDPEGYLMERITFDSTDGAQPTMVVVRPKNKSLDGTTRMLVHAYASGGSAKLPEFRLDHAAWLEAGGAIALVQARGGGEQGEAWVEAGLRERKLNTVRDILAATDYLVTHQYTARRHLAFWGRSWGGLLANMLIAFVPRAFAAVSPVVPMADMVRYAEMGLGEKWLDQFGDASKPEELRWMRELSPLRHVSETTYPAVLILCGEKDNRVGPAHSYMMAAALQRNQQGPKPILLHTQHGAGHNGIGRRAEDDRVSAMMLAFLWNHTR